MPKHTPKLWVRDALSLLAAGLAVAQALGTLGEIDMKPGLFIHGGLGRLVEFLEGKGWVPQWLVWMKLVGNWAICAFWSFLALAGSRLMCEAVPGFQSGREQQWFFLQKRRTYVWPLLVLVTSHAAGNWLAMKGWWLAAVPLELMGHATIAFLLYVLWVPESRAALAVVVDVVGRGHNSRVSFSQTDYRFSFSRRWDTIRHDNLNSAVLRNSIFSRLMGTAHLELIWREPRSQKINRILLKGIGFKDEVSQLVGFLNGPFREGKPLSYMHPSTMVGQTHNNEPTT